MLDFDGDTLDFWRRGLKKWETGINRARAEMDIFGGR